MLDVDLIREGLEGTLFGGGGGGGGVECLEEAGSTNDLVAGRGREGAGEGLVIFAEYQTSGRGRRGEAWVSPPGENLLFSLLVRPAKPPLRWSRLTHLMALAICLGMEEVLPHVAARIKWPNDVYVGGKKVSGILIEGHGEFVVIGAGVNVNGRSANFPAEFRGSSTTLREQIGDRGAIVRERLAVAVLGHFDTLYRPDLGRFAEVRDAVWSRSELAGKEVRARAANEMVVGKVTGLGPEGELVLLQPDGQERLFPAADWVRQI